MSVAGSWYDNLFFIGYSERSFDLVSTPHIGSRRCVCLRKGGTTSLANEDTVDLVAMHTKPILLLNNHPTSDLRLFTYRYKRICSMHAWDLYFLLESLSAYVW